jgi:hypothetical protein
VDGGKLKIGFGTSEDVCVSPVGFAFVGAFPNNELNGPPLGGCAAGAVFPKVLTGVSEVVDVCPNGLLEGLKAEMDGPNIELEEGALAGGPNKFAVGCAAFVDCPNNDVCGLGSSGFCLPKPKRLLG